MVELGPGDSLGIGLAALLSGVERYIALDVIQYASDAQNLRIFEELIALFKDRAPIPDEAEFPLVRPLLPSYAFPADLVTSALGRGASPGSVGAGSTRHYQSRASPVRRWPCLLHSPLEAGRD